MYIAGHCQTFGVYLPAVYPVLFELMQRPRDETQVNLLRPKYQVQKSEIDVQKYLTRNLSPPRVVIA